MTTQKMLQELSELAPELQIAEVNPTSVRFDHSCNFYYGSSRWLLIGKIIEYLEEHEQVEVTPPKQIDGAYLCFVVDAAQTTFIGKSASRLGALLLVTLKYYKAKPKPLPDIDDMSAEDLLKELAERAPKHFGVGKTEFSLDFYAVHDPGGGHEYAWSTKEMDTYSGVIDQACRDACRELGVRLVVFENPGSHFVSKEFRGNAEECIRKGADTLYLSVLRVTVEVHRRLQDAS